MQCMGGLQNREMVICLGDLGDSIELVVQTFWLAVSIILDK